jgi:putative nucleotidyltransferase with HDIG domain
MRFDSAVHPTAKATGYKPAERPAPADQGKIGIDKVIQQIEHLPTLPQVVMRILSIAESPRISALELSKAMDQSLAAKVLKVANSVFYGGRAARNINNLHHAIMMIGFESVKEIILTTSFFHTFQDAQDIRALQPLWQHSLECALISKRLAWMFRYDSMDEAYLSGLTHDIGRLVIQQYFGDQYREIEEKKGAGVEMLQAERETLNITHAEIGGKIAERWAFPINLVDAITHHHDRDWKINPDLGRILFNTDQFTSGLMNFTQMLEAFAQEGVAYPATWDSSDLASVEMILLEEIGKAQSMFNVVASKPAFNPSPRSPARFLPQEK